jgi:hypothetical protein
LKLDLDTVERIERFIVFESKVELLHWEDTSQWGFKIKLGLLSRQELDAFDKTMKRSKKRGGQRYHCILYGEFNRQFEAQFCGRGWAETLGAHIALHIPDTDDQIWFRFAPTRDQGDKETVGRSCDLMLMEIGDDEIIIDQTMRSRVETLELKGGPHSKHVAMLLQDEAFNRWMSCHSLYRRPEARPDDPAACYTLDDIDALVKEVCGIKSKVEFDHDEEAWQRWETQFHRPFIQAMNHGR